MQSVPALIEAISALEPPANQPEYLSSPGNPVVQALRMITGENFGKDLEKWRAWWDAHGADATPADSAAHEAATQ